MTCPFSTGTPDRDSHQVTERIYAKLRLRHAPADSALRGSILMEIIDEPGSAIRSFLLVEQSGADTAPGHARTEDDGDRPGWS